MSEKRIYHLVHDEARRRAAPGLDGGMVLLGQRTSKFGKREFGEWLEFLNATAQRGVGLEFNLCFLDGRENGDFGVK